jgi:23S rRNA G2445 N2-methylase RlmL
MMLLANSRAKGTHAAMAAVKIFALTSRGLEWVGAEEMAKLPGIRVTDISYRKISAVYSNSLPALLALKTVDDIFVEVTTWKNIVPQREALDHLQQLSAQLDLAPAVALISKLRPEVGRPAFSITASFIGKRNYGWKEIKNAVAAGIHASYTWEYTDESDSDLNIRVFIDHDRAIVGIRLSEKPMHRRAYKRMHLDGSLKPSVAAALVFLSNLTPGSVLLDPFCGTGTILVEGALMGAKVLGGDIDPVAIAAATVNSHLAGVKTGRNRWDARDLPFATGSVDRVVTNLPWGRQVKIGENLAGFYQKVCAEIARVLAPDGRVVLITNSPHWVTFPDLLVEPQFEISLFGQKPTIMSFSKPL